MNVRTAALASIAVALIVAACGGSGSQWERFHSAGGGYSFLVPHPPEVETAFDDSGFGTIEFTRYSMKLDSTLFITLYSDLTPDNLEAYSADELVTFAAENMVELTDGTLISDERISLGGAPGREFKIQMNEEGLKVRRILHTRVYQVGARQFQITTISYPEEQHSPDVVGFLDSLRIE